MSKLSLLQGLELFDPSSYSTSPNCFLCGSQSPSSSSSPKQLSNCHMCGNTFCKFHLIKTRPDEHNQRILHPFCEKCERAFISKQIFDEFNDKKIKYEQEISEMKAEESILNQEILIKTETIDGIRRSKDQLISHLALEALSLGQDIEQVVSEGRGIEKELQAKNLEREALIKELERVEAVVKEMSESPESPMMGYEYIWGDGLMKKKEEEKGKKRVRWEEGVCGCDCSRLC